MLTDQSPAKEETWKFLDRRLENILTAGKTLGDVKVVAGAALDGIWNLVGGISEPPKREVRNPIEELRQQNNSNNNEQHKWKQNKLLFYSYYFGYQKQINLHIFLNWFWGWKSIFYFLNFNL